MITINQLIKKKVRIKRKTKTGVRYLEGNPYKKGICISREVIAPKKPNSAKRKIALIKIKTKLKQKKTYKYYKKLNLSNYQTEIVRVYVPGINNNLQQFMTVLIKGNTRKDLISIHSAIVNGTRDVPGIEGRKTSRSKYGVKKNK